MELVGHDSKSMSAHYTHVGAEARGTSGDLNCKEVQIRTFLLARSRSGVAEVR